MLHLSLGDMKTMNKICHALSSPLRTEIMRLLETRVLSCNEIAKELGYPLSTISMNVTVLEQAGLCLCERYPAKNGTKRMCSRVYGDISIRLSGGDPVAKGESSYEAEMPIGNYMDFSVEPSCGMVTGGLDVDLFDKPTAFLAPERLDAQLIWFRKGYIEYQFPLPASARGIRSLSFQMELCSEAPGYNNKWKSDITMWVNGAEVGTWTCPSDFGDRRGVLTPAYWELGSTQYGLLTSWKIDRDGACLNGEPLSGVNLARLGLHQGGILKMRIGVKEDAKYAGGLNLFGRGFGDYPQDIKMYIEYS